MWSLQHIEMYREQRELTHALLQCMSGLASDGVQIPSVVNLSGRGVESFLAAPGEAHALWAESFTTPFRLHGVERAAFEVSRRPLQLAFAPPKEQYAHFQSLLSSIVVGAQKASVDPRLCNLFYGLTETEARAVRHLSAASLMLLASRIHIRIDEKQVQCLQQALPLSARGLQRSTAQQLVLAVTGSGMAQREARKQRSSAGESTSHSCETGKKIRVRADEIRNCLLSHEDTTHIAALAHLHEKGVKRPGLHGMRGINKAALMLSGVGVKPPQRGNALRLGMEERACARMAELKKRSFAQHALLLVQLYRSLDPLAQLEIAVDPWAFAVASDMLDAVSRKHHLNMYHQYHILRAYNAGLIEIATCATHQLEYLVTSDDAEFSIDSACPACELARGGAYDGTDEWDGVQAGMVASA